MVEVFETFAGWVLLEIYLDTEHKINVVVDEFGFNADHTVKVLVNKLIKK